MSRVFHGVRRIHFLAPRIARRVGNGQEVVFHNIKAKRKKYGGWTSRVLVGTVAAVFMVETYSYLVLDPLVKAVEELPEVEVEHDDDDDDEIFIALPLTTQEVKPPPYSAKDPEWAEFVRISKDQPLRQKMKNILATLVLGVANNSQSIVNRYGKPVKVTGGMLDIDFPIYPPPIHRQLGILINDEAIAIAYRERESSLARMEERVLWPKPLAMATWGVVTTALLQSKDVLYKALFGAYTDGLIEQDTLRADAPPAIASATAKPSDVQKAIQAIREQATRKPGELPTSDTTDMASSGKPAQKDVSPGASNGPSSRTSHSTNANTKDAKEPPKEMSHITAAFWDKFARGYPRKRAYPPRGSVAVTGMVIVDTPKAWLHVDVVAYWDPKTSKYDVSSMQMGLRNVRTKVISPLR